MTLRIVVRLRDGQVLSGYTPAFEPRDGAVWISPAPSSPAGTMLRLDRADVLVLEARDGRPIRLPDSAVAIVPSVGVRIGFTSGEPLFGKLKADVPQLGTWVEPIGRSSARAFIPASVKASLLRGDVADVDDGGWGFVVSASELLEVALLESPTAKVEAPSRAAVAAARARAKEAAMKTGLTEAIPAIDVGLTQPDLPFPAFPGPEFDFG